MIRKSMLALFALCLAMGIPASADEPATQTTRVFELRTYTAAPGKLAELHRRFREHTLKFFEQHGMENIGYWTPQAGPASTSTIVYLLAHESKTAAEKSWAAFSADPEWQKVKRASEANGALVTKVESVFLDPTDYSSIR
jgi:hypothetical protein